MMTTQFSGFAASPGKYSGTARVLTQPTESELERVIKGDILVAPFTTPAYVPAMRRSAAILTAVGGITCHAAMMAREFHIPAVVGIGKESFLRIPDGARLEVDGDAGTVRLL